MPTRGNTPDRQALAVALFLKRVPVLYPASVLCVIRPARVADSHVGCFHAAAVDIDAGRSCEFVKVIRIVRARALKEGCIHIVGGNSLPGLAERAVLARRQRYRSNEA